MALANVIDVDLLKITNVGVDVSSFGKEPKNVRLIGQITDTGKLGISEHATTELESYKDRGGILWLPPDLEPEYDTHFTSDEPHNLLGFVAVGTLIDSSFRTPTLHTPKGDTGILIANLLKNSKTQDSDDVGQWLWLYTKKKTLSKTPSIS